MRVRVCAWVGGLCVCVCVCVLQMPTSCRGSDWGEETFSHTRPGAKREMEFRSPSQTNLTSASSSTLQCMARRVCAVRVVQPEVCRARTGPGPAGPVWSSGHPSRCWQWPLPLGCQWQPPPQPSALWLRFARTDLPVLLAEPPSESVRLRMRWPASEGPGASESVPVHLVLLLGV